MRMNMPKGSQFKPNKGFAYVDFDTPEAVTIAVSMSENNLDGRRLLIKDSKSYEGRPKNENAQAAEKSLLEGSEATTGGQAESKTSSLSKSARKILDRQKNSPAPCLFIGNLSFDATVGSAQGAAESINTPF